MWSFTLLIKESRLYGPEKEGQELAEAGRRHVSRRGRGWPMMTPRDLWLRLTGIKMGGHLPEEHGYFSP